MSERQAEISFLQGGRYQVISILGAGGFGITYRCEDRRTGEICAIKEYMPEAIAYRDIPTGEIVCYPEKMNAYLHGKKRFLEEAELLMNMSNITYVVQVWGTFEENNTAYYVMEFLQGKTLKQLMRAMGGKLPYTAALEAVVKAGTALDMVHRQAGIFHRDISPENIMVMPDGSVKIIDFGSAKSMAVSEDQQFSVVLKPGFAPPEQYASNLSQGSFTDVYALAGTFYYAASGKMIPVAPDRLMGVPYEPMDQVVPECGKETAEAVDKALHLDAKYRTQTVSEFLSGITQVTVPLKREPSNGGENTAGTAAPAITAAATESYASEAPAVQASSQMPVTPQVQVPPQMPVTPQVQVPPQMPVTPQVPVPPQMPVTPQVQVPPQVPVTPQVQVPPQRPVTPRIPSQEPVTPAAPAGPMGWLEVVKGACAGQRFAVEPNKVISVGRSASRSYIILSGHGEISGLHFRLCWMPHKNGFYVIDESSNGLYYKGFRLQKGKKYKILPGDQLGVGSMECIITVGR